MEKTVKINLYGENMKIDLPKKYEQFLYNIINLLNIDNLNVKALVIFYYVQDYKKSKKIFISNSNDYYNFLDYFSHDYVKIFVRISDEYLEHKILKKLDYEKKYYYKKNKNNEFYNHSHSKNSSHSHTKHREKSKKKEDKTRNFYEERRKVRERSRSNSALRVMKVRI